MSVLFRIHGGGLLSYGYGPPQAAVPSRTTPLDRRGETGLDERKFQRTLGESTDWTVTILLILLLQKILRTSHYSSKQKMQESANCLVCSTTLLLALLITE